MAQEQEGPLEPAGEPPEWDVCGPGPAPYKNGHAQPVNGAEVFWAPEYSDEALALAFADRHEQRLRYVAVWGKWICWTGAAWKTDTTLAGFDYARRLCRAVANEAQVNHPKLPKGITSAKTIAAVEKLAKSDRRLAATVEQWDEDIFQLGTPNGTVELQTGELRAPDPSDYITRLTAVSPAPIGTQCPLWLAFLTKVMDGNLDMVDYLQRVAGYALTGSTQEHCLWFAYGTGRNGKGVFINTLTKILGDYSAVASVETFVDTKNPQHSTDLAMLRGARLVTAQETEEGRRWAEAKIKGLTGGDPITARFMRQDFFTYDPNFKILIAGNHKPGLRAVDEAMKARMRFVPFKVTIAEDERDAELAEKLKAEWPAILRWAIEGCLEWQEGGLRTPLLVREATDEYMAEEDAFLIWLEEWCVREKGAHETNEALFKSWKSWADAAGEMAGSQKRFSQTMQAHGFSSGKHREKRGFYGARLKKPAYDDEDPHKIVGWV